MNQPSRDGNVSLFATASLAASATRESARILAHAKTLLRLPDSPAVAGVLECGGLPPLSPQDMPLELRAVRGLETSENNLPGCRCAITT
ncbi:MAG: hypothetical protein AVDCRST_MAG42-1619 [uncultured Chthoniobacterales bacterium]|uniref:Uncharacterized protein n=1 Tax=uncultured Chthoniobacterales bacterium TaxID=1836801 RepID=A0A6J4I104_9BACT|nr:MAG: hypothetical protein AVDCRST_MAG42-1619 [uncultured Chthoniobacterales bacterium]